MESQNGALMTVNMSLKSIVNLSDEQLEKFVTLAHGSRRPTKHPEFLSLDVLGGGFASGELAAVIKTDEDKRLQASLLTSRSGFGAMQALLTSGNYQVELPENGAMLVVAWLLEEGRTSEARELLAQLAPYMDEVKFVPTVVASPPPLAPTTASLGTVERARKQLAHAEARGAAKQALQQPRNDVNAELMDLQAQAVALLVQTLGPGELPRQGATVRNVIPESCAFPFLLSLTSNSRRDATSITTKLEQLLQNATASNRHRRQTSATNALLCALREVSKGENAVSSDSLKIVTVRIRVIMASVLSRRGAWGSEKYEQHMRNVAISVQGDQRHIAARVVMARLGARQDFETLTAVEVERALEAMSIDDAQRVVHSDSRILSLPRLKSCHRKAVKGAMEGTLEELLNYRVVKSGEEVGTVAHVLVSRFKSTQFTDVRLSRLYAEIATAFSRRRSLLLISGPGALQHQVRMTELPWIVPLLSEISKTRATQKLAQQPPELSFARELLVQYWKHFPVTLMPNKLTSALRELLHPTPITTSKRPQVTRQQSEDGTPPVLEELAADIFGGFFSPKYHTVARIAANRIANTTYSRYYQLDGMLPQLASGEITLDAAVSSLRNTYYGSDAPTRGWSVSYNGTMIEAAQILTTHNLILFDDVMSSDTKQLHLLVMLDNAWTQMVRLSARSTINMQFRVMSQHRRQVAHAVRHFVYFLSKLPTSAEQLTFLDEHMVNPKQECLGFVCAIRCAVQGFVVHPTEHILGWRHIGASSQGQSVNQSQPQEVPVAPPVVAQGPQTTSVISSVAKAIGNAVTGLFSSKS